MQQTDPIRDAFDLSDDYPIDPVFRDAATHINAQTGLLNDYNDGDAYFAETGDVLCIKARSNRAIPHDLLRSLQDDEGLYISLMKSKGGQAYIEVRPE